MKRPLLKDMLTSIVGTGLLQLIGVVTAVLAARLLGPSGRGEVAAAVAWALLLGAVTDLGLSQSLPHYVAKERSGVGATSIVVTGAVWAVLTPVFVVAIRLVGPELSVAGIVYATASIPLALTTNYMGTLFQGESRHPVFTAYRIGANLPYLGGLIMAAFLGSRMPDTVLWSALALSVLVVLIGLGYAHRFSSFFGAPSIAVAKTLLGYGMRAYFGNLAWAGNRHLPILLVGGAVGATSLGFYSVAMSYGIVPFAVATAFALLAPGRIAGRTKMDGIAESRRLRRVGSTATWLATVPLLLAVNTVLPWIFGQSFVPAVAPARLLLVASALIGTNFLLSSCLRSLGRPAAPSFAEGAGLIVTVVAIPVLTRTFGLIGAAWGVLVSAAVVGCLLMKSLRGMERDAPVDSNLRISVLTPAFNAAEHISELLESVRLQDYPNYEHIVIDDGSTDATLDLLNKAPDVTVVSRGNLGQYATQNELLDLATGDVIVIISSDDYFARSDALRLVVAAFASGPAVDVVVGRTPRWVEGEFSYLARPDVPLWLGIRCVKSCLAIQHCSVFVRRALLVENHIRFDDSYSMAGDWRWLAEVLSAARGVRAVRADLATWRMHSAQTSRRALELGKVEKVKVLAAHGVALRRHYWLRRIFNWYARPVLGIALLREHGVSVMSRKVWQWFAKHRRTNAAPK